MGVGFCCGWAKGLSRLAQGGRFRQVLVSGKTVESVCEKRVRAIWGRLGRVGGGSGRVGRGVGAGSRGPFQRPLQALNRSSGGHARSQGGSGVAEPLQGPLTVPGVAQ